jgi:hypothetical protein
MPEKPEKSESRPKRRWVSERYQAVLENVLAEVLAKLVLAALAVMAGAAAAISLLVWKKTHLSLAWRVILVVSSIALLVSFLVALFGVLRLAHRTRRLQLFDVGELEDQLAQFGFALEFMRGVLETLQEMFAVDEPFDYDDIAEGAILDPARDFLARAPGEHVRLSVLVPDDDVFRMRWAAGHRPLSKANFELPVAGSWAGRAYNQNTTQRCPDVREEPDFILLPRATRPFKTLVCAPVKMGNSVAAVLNVVSSYADVFTETDVLFIESLASVISVLLALEFDDERD